MKKRIFVSICCAAAVAALSACTDKTDKNKDSAPDTDSSHYSVNYTDTGDYGIKNSSSEIDHASSVKEISSSAANNSALSSQKSGTADGATTPSAASSVQSSDTRRSTTKTTITYYYYDDNGSERSYDTEIDTDTEFVSEESSEASFAVPEHTDSDVMSPTDTSSDSDTDIDVTYDTDTSAVPEGEFTENDLSFTVDELVISYGMDVKEVTEVLGEPLYIDEIPNKSTPEFVIKIYNYDKFFIIADPNDDGSVYTITAMEIFSDALETEKGVRIGMKVEDVEKIYGSDFLICDDEYRYYIGGRYFYLYVQNDIVANIGFGFDEDIGTD